MHGHEGFAITGMACVFPGAASLAAYWDRVLRAEPAPQAALSERWGIPSSRIVGPVGAPHRTYLDRAFVLPWDEVPRLDPDPQVAVGKHVVLEALRAAESQGGALDRASTALVVGTSWTAPSFFEADAELARGGGRRGAVPYTPETQLDLLAGDLRGARFAVDTACASSLYAIDVATRLLAGGDARAVVVLGVNALLTPFLYVGFSKLRALSPEGMILPFAANASGIVPGEGAGAIVLESLAPALHAGRRISAVVRGIGLSADGAERSVFAPGERGERLAYERAHAGLEPGRVDYVEAHGTATAVGDETEMLTLDAFFGADREAPLPIGSVKSLVGHTLAAAGMASVIKCALMLERDTVPPHVRVVPHPSLARTRLALPTAPARLARSAEGARVGVSAFGFGGSNAHVVLDRAPSLSATKVSAPAMRHDDTLAVIDLVVTAGSAHGAAEVAAVVDGRRELGSRTLADATTIDAAGLRMGPNLLRRLDPLQLLLASATRDALAPLGELDGERVGVVMVSNLGGDTSLRLSRRDLFAADAPDLTVETIASSLPSMASGYPAYHLDLRGFHETIAGDASTFGALLATTARWLEDACDVLVLGTGRIVKSPLEWGDGDASPGEAFGVVVLTTEARARARGWPVRALLTREAAAHGRDDGAIVRERFGVLVEAEPLVRLAAALGGGPDETTLSLSNRDFRVRRVSRLSDAQRSTPKLPLSVTLERVLPKSPRPESAHRVESAAVDVAGLLSAIASSEAAARDVLATHRQAFALAGGAAEPAPIASASRIGPSVLEAMQVGAGRATARVVVDETDPYFFDHPLDHVPGILLVAAIEELVWRVAEASGGEAWISSLALSFRRFCEKDRPIEIELTVGRDAAEGRVTQAGTEVGRFDVAWRAAPPVVGVTPSRDGEPRVAAATVHKRRPENVLVGPLTRLGESYVCKMHAPPAGHFLARSSPRFASALRLLEGGRQVVMCGAHDVMGLPVGAPMNLLKITLDLSAPVPADATLVGTLVLGQHLALGEVTIGDVSVVLGSIDGATRYGTLGVKAQVVDAATYAAQRGTT